MATFISSSPEETIALGAAWGREGEAGWVIGLTGELGAGKTQLVKGIAQGLGLAGRVTSPSFALVHEHRGGRLALFHLDLYRLETPEQIRRAGLEEYLYEPPGLTVVEWIERWTAGLGGGLGSGRASAGLPGTGSPITALPGRYRQVWIETISETMRRISYEDSGA